MWNQDSGCLHAFKIGLESKYHEVVTSSARDCLKRTSRQTFKNQGMYMKIMYKVWKSYLLHNLLCQKKGNNLKQKCKYHYGCIKCQILAPDNKIRSLLLKELCKNIWLILLIFFWLHELAKEKENPPNQCPMPFCNDIEEIEY